MAHGTPSFFQGSGSGCHFTFKPQKARHNLAPYLLDVANSAWILSNLCL